MENKVKEYIRYYIGQEAFSYDEQRNGIITGIGNDFVRLDINGVGLLASFTNIKPILRRIESLTDEEISVVGKTHTFKEASGNPISSPKLLQDIRIMTLDKNFRTNIQNFHYLLSIGIDLFNLIDNNLAIEK